MSSAEMERTVAEIEVRGSNGVSYGLRANGSVLKFDGFLKLYEEGRDDTVSAMATDGCRRWRRAMRRAPKRLQPGSISPSRRRALPQPRSSN